MTAVIIPQSERLAHVVRQITGQIKSSRRQESLSQLLRGMLYIELKRAYSIYETQARIEGQEVETYAAYLVGLGFAIDRKTNRNQLANVAGRYIGDYKLARLVKSPDGMLDLADIDPLLLAVANYKLAALLPFHNTPDQARDMLAAAESMSRKRFDEWLQEHLAISAAERVKAEYDQLKSFSQAREQSPLRLTDSKVTTVESWQLKQMRLDDIVGRIELPDDIDPAKSYTLTVSYTLEEVTTK